MFMDTTAAGQYQTNAIEADCQRCAVFDRYTRFSVSVLIYTVYSFPIGGDTLATEESPSLQNIGTCSQ